MRLDQMPDEALAAEFKRQKAIQECNQPHTQMWMAAARIIHHVAQEQERRARSKEKAE